MGARVFFGIITAVLGIVAAEPAGAEDYAAFIVGIGQQSCASWLSTPYNRLEGSAWIFGFWSATNVANVPNGHVGESTDGAGILGEVEVICRARPSASLLTAVIEVFASIRSRESKR